jgi:hypothetical protein
MFNWVKRIFWFGSTYLHQMWRLGMILLCLRLCFSLPVVATSQDSLQVNLQIKPGQNLPEQVWLVDRAYYYFEPERADPGVYGKTDLKFGIQNFGLVQNGVCTFRIRPYGANDASFDQYSLRLTVRSALLTHGTCKTKLPKKYVVTPRWDVEVRLVDTSSGLIYGYDTSYAYLFGPIAVVKISVVQWVG